MFVLYLIDPPNLPNPTLTTLNETALQVSWTEPFSWEGFPVLNYTLNIRNMTSSSLIDTIVTSDTGVNSFEHVFTVGSVLSECHTISVEVTASNSVGESSPGVANGGFPIGKNDVFLLKCVEG